MRNHWEFYICPVENHLSSIALDIGLAQELPLEKMEWLIAVSIEMKTPIEGGFMSEEEQPLLEAIESKLKTTLEEDERAIQVGRVTGNGVRDLIFYGSTITGVTELIEKVMGNGLYQYKIYQKEEPQWDTYWEFLYPNPWQVRMIENRHLFEHLLSQGDQVDQVRPVDHYTFFETEEPAKEYAEFIEESGEEWITGSIEFKEEIETDFKWCVHQICQQKVDLMTANQKSAFCFEKAYELGGEYDGWGTELYKVPEANE